MAIDVCHRSITVNDWPSITSIPGCYPWMPSHEVSELVYISTFCIYGVRWCASYGLLFGVSVLGMGMCMRKAVDELVASEK